MRYMLATIACLGLVFTCQSPLSAKEPATKGAENKNKNKQFDTDGDGKLNPAEKAAARTQLEGNKPGRQSIETLLRKFDANGNGKLDPDERLKAKEELKALKERMEENRPNAVAGQNGLTAQSVRRGQPAGQNGQAGAQQFPGGKANPFPGGRPAGVARPGQPSPFNKAAKK